MEDKLLPEKNIVIFTNGNLFSRIILEKFLKKYQTQLFVVVIVTGDYFGNKGINAITKYLKSTTLPFVLFKVWTLIIIKLLHIFNPNLIANVKDLCKKFNVNYMETSNINQNHLFDTIKNSNSEYLISVSCPQLIKAKWLEFFRGNGINIHSSLLPQYAGLAPYFWVLSEGGIETGISVHYLTEGFDKGNILSAKKIVIENRTSSYMLFLKLCLLGQNNLIEGFEKMKNFETGIYQDRSKKTYFSNPTIKAYQNLIKKGFCLFRITDLKFLYKTLKSFENKKYIRF